MNKLAIVAAAPLVVALLALPAAIGGIVEADVRERVAAIDADPFVSAQLRSFERGWFRSTARIELRVAPDNLPPPAVAELGSLPTLPIVVEHAHGPVAILDGIHFGLAKLVVRPETEAPGIAELTETLGVPYLFEFRGRSGYLGGLDFDADAPPFKLPIEEGLLTFSGATLRGNFAAPRFEADGRIGSLELTSEGGSFAVRAINFSFDSEVRQHVMPGEASFTIDEISAVDGLRAATLFQARNLKFTSEAAVDPAGELLDVRARYDVDSMRSEEGEVTAGVLGVAIRNVDVAAIQAYTKIISDAAATAADPTAVAAELAPHIERALRAGPSIAFDPIRFHYDGEPFNARVDVRTDPARLPAAGVFSLDNPLLLMGAFDANAELRVSKALATKLAAAGARERLSADPTVPPERLAYMAEAQASLVLATLIGQGLLVDDGDAYRSSFVYENGAVTLNDNPLPFGLP